MNAAVAQVLFITANPKPAEQSFGLSVANEFLNVYRQENPNDEIVHLDLFKMDVPNIDGVVLSAWGKLQAGTPFEELTADEMEKVSRLNQIVDQFVAADKYIFVTPMWNLSIPPVMKSYIDAIMVAGKTFKYTEQGPVGLLSDKKAVHIQARGGVYSEGPAKEVEFGDRYIQSVLAFVGVPSVQSIIVEGMAQDPSQAEAIKAKAIERAKEVAKSFAAQSVNV